VHSVLWLILAFFSAAGLFVLLGAEFLAMLLVVVYVGAVAVLFLFVVMMLDVDFAELRQGFARYMPIGGLVAGILAIEMIVVSTSVAGGGADKAHPLIPATDVTNAETIGRVLYTQYVYYFQAAGMVLLVAMIGAIVLTLRHKPGVRRQQIADQVARTRATGLRVVSIKSGEGSGQ
jgi:NADH-quinone oxidoreductase subunit J